MSTQLDQAGRDIIAEQAAKWLTELADGDGKQRADFVAWLKQSPRHVEEFLFASATLRAFSRTRDREAPTSQAELAEIDRVVADALAASTSANVVALEQASTIDAGSARPDPREAGVSRPSRRRRVPWYIAAAAALGVVSLAGLLMPQLRSLLDPNSFTTSMGEQRTVRLADGSIVYLNARSRIDVNLSAGSRDIELREGEAVFKVQHDAARPFRVHTGDAVVQAVGTQFNVYRRPHETTVSVLEGKVAVHAADAAQVLAGQAADPLSSTAAEQTLLVAAGEQASVESSGQMLKRAQPDVAAAIAWRERRLVFRADTLEHIAAEFSRYTPKRIRLEDEAARQKRITGTFDADDPASLMLFLDELDDLSVQRDGEDFVVREQ